MPFAVDDRLERLRGAAEGGGVGLGRALTSLLDRSSWCTVSPERSLIEKCPANALPEDSNWGRRRPLTLTRDLSAHSDRFYKCLLEALVWHNRRTMPT